MLTQQPLFQGLGTVDWVWVIFLYDFGILRNTRIHYFSIVIDHMIKFYFSLVNSYRYLQQANTIAVGKPVDRGDNDKVVAGAYLHLTWISFCILRKYAVSLVNAVNARNFNQNSILCQIFTQIAYYVK